MPVTVESRILETIEASCNINPSDILKFDDFNSKTCYVFIREDEKRAGIELTKDDAREVVIALKKWRND